jgi:hypothetical protein
MRIQPAGLAILEPESSDVIARRIRFRLEKTTAFVGPVSDSIFALARTDLRLLLAMSEMVRNGQKYPMKQMETGFKIHYTHCSDAGSSIRDARCIKNASRTSVVISLLMSSTYNALGA